MRNPKEIAFLAGDFWRYLRGADYFRQPQGLGPYFEDCRCYYNDLRHKADWNGPYVGGVPALTLVRSGETAVLPVMVLLYGLGNADRYFLENDAGRLEAIHRVADWLLDNVLPEGYFDNGLSRRNPATRFYSDNSAMSQGLALSFASRAILFSLIDGRRAARLRETVEKVIANMLLPIQRAGTGLYRGDDVFLLEDCSHDETVVLNGWIFGVFGLFDYLRLEKSAGVQSSLDSTLATMERALPRYTLASGWSYYDDQGRISSPFYHDLHISLLEALHRLTKAERFASCCQTFGKANTRWNRTRYTINKIKDRLFDSNALGG